MDVQVLMCLTFIVLCCSLVPFLENVSPNFVVQIGDSAVRKETSFYPFLDQHLPVSTTAKV